MHHALPVPLAVTASKERHRALDLGFARLVHFLIPVPARHQHALHVLKEHTLLWWARPAGAHVQCVGLEHFVPPHLVQAKVALFQWINS